MNDLNLPYTPTLGSPWEAVQIAIQAWNRELQASPLYSNPPLPSILPSTVMGQHRRIHPDCAHLPHRSAENCAILGRALLVREKMADLRVGFFVPEI